MKETLLRSVETALMTTEIIESIIQLIQAAHLIKIGLRMMPHTILSVVTASMMTEMDF